MNQSDLAIDPIMRDKRESIDSLDQIFLILLAQRAKVIEKIIFLKKQEGLDQQQSKERKQDLKQLIDKVVSKELGVGFFKDFFDLIFKESFKFGQSEFLVTENPRLTQLCEGLKIEDLRASLINFEQALCLMLAERFRLVRIIGKYKKKLGVLPLDNERWQQVLQGKIDFAKKLQLKESLIVKIYNAIHEAALDIEGKVME